MMTNTNFNAIVESATVAIDAMLAGNTAAAILVLTTEGLEHDRAVAFLASQHDAIVLAPARKRAERVAMANIITTILANVDALLDEGKTEAAAWAQAEHWAGISYEAAQARCEAAS